MAKYIKKIRTADGDKQIDFEALANVPNYATVEQLNSAMLGEVVLYNHDIRVTVTPTDGSDQMAYIDLHWTLPVSDITKAKAVGGRQTILSMISYSFTSNNAVLSGNGYWCQKIGSQIIQVPIVGLQYDYTKDQTIVTLAEFSAEGKAGVKSTFEGASVVVEVVAVRSYNGQVMCCDGYAIRDIR